MNDDDKRLIEDYLPIVAIRPRRLERATAKGHISTLHLWWARRPLVACRAAVYGALVPASQFVPKNGPDTRREGALAARMRPSSSNGSALIRAALHTIQEAQQADSRSACGSTYRAELAAWFLLPISRTAARRGRASSICLQAGVRFHLRRHVSVASLTRWNSIPLRTDRAVHTELSAKVRCRACRRRGEVGQAHARPDPGRCGRRSRTNRPPRWQGRSQGEAADPCWRD